MTIGKLSNGEFAGTYITAVTTTKKEIKASPLVGTQHSKTQPTFGFTVNWSFTGSSPLLVVSPVLPSTPCAFSFRSTLPCGALMLGSPALCQP